MKAEQFYKQIICNIKSPTIRKVEFRAKKYNLYDTYDEVSYWTGLIYEKHECFIKR